MARFPWAGFPIMKTLRLRGFCLLIAGLLSTCVRAGQEAAPTELGLSVGQRAPAFTLKDQNGHEVSLDALLKKGPVALVFYRSADWCMYCKFQLIQIQRNLKQFQAVGAQIVGISYDSTAKIKRFADSRGITIPLLSDVGSKTIDAYGVRDKTAADPKEGFAAHATFVLDQQGIVRAKLLNVIYQEQPGVGFLVDALKEAGKASAATSTKSPEKNPVSRNTTESGNPET
jgi:peroxiredoxin